MSSTKFAKAIVSASLIAASLSFASALAADKPVTLVIEEIVAKVNGQIVTRGELDKQKLEAEAELRRQGLTGKALEDATNRRMADGLRDQIDQLLLVQKGNELGIKVDADITKRMAQIQSDQKISDPDKFHEFVEQQTGETFEDFKKQMTDQMLTQRVIQEEVYRNITIPKADIDKYYNEHKSEFVRQEMVALREILVSTGDGSATAVAAAEKKAKGLVDRIRKGDAKFTDMARQYSDAPTATADGELGAFKKGELAQEIDEVVFKHDKGYVTDPIRRPAGFEIYRVDEHYAAGQASEDEVADEINAKLIEPMAGPKVRAYLTDLRKNAFLEIKAGYIDSAAAPGKDTTWQDTLQLKPETTTKEAVAAHHHKRFLKVIPYGHVKPQADESPAPPPTAPVVPEAPVAVPAVPSDTK